MSSQQRRSGGPSLGGIVLMLIVGVILGGAAYYSLHPSEFPLTTRKPAPLPVKTPEVKPAASVAKPIAPKAETPPAVDQVTGLPLDEVATRGLSDYLVRYAKKTGDESEAGQDNACINFEHAKAAQNDARLLALTPEQQQQFKDARRLLQAWDNADYQVAEALAGGGTMYAHMQNREGAATEDFLGGFMKKLNNRARHASARSLANRKLHSLAQQLQDIGKADFHDQPDYASQFSEEYDKLQKLQPKLQVFIDRLPDNAAQSFAEQIGDLMSSME